MNITIPIWSVLAVGFVVAVAITVAYFKGKLTVVYGDFKLINKALNVLNDDREAWQKERTRLMAQACVSSGQCRRTPEEYEYILFNKMLDRKNELQDEECTDDDCETCEPKCQPYYDGEVAGTPPAGGPDPLPLCQTCHVYASCKERDDDKEHCEGHILRADLSTDNQQGVCKTCHYANGCSEYAPDKLDCNAHTFTPPKVLCNNCSTECDFRSDEGGLVENCFTFKPKADTQSVTEANKEAAESVKGDTTFCLECNAPMQNTDKYFCSVDCTCKYHKVDEKIARMKELSKEEGGSMGNGHFTINVKYGQQMSDLGIDDILISNMLYEYNPNTDDIYGLLYGIREITIKDDIVKRYESPQDDNHDKALDRCNSTKKAAQESIGMTEEQRDAVNSKIDN
jgi:hypothetical protein